jgi:hypothetical protein
MAPKSPPVISKTQSIRRSRRTQRRRRVQDAAIQVGEHERQADEFQFDHAIGRGNTFARNGQRAIVVAAEYACLHRQMNLSAAHAASRRYSAHRSLPSILERPPMFRRFVDRLSGATFDSCESLPALKPRWCSRAASTLRDGVPGQPQFGGASSCRRTRRRSYRRRYRFNDAPPNGDTLRSIQRRPAEARARQGRRGKCAAVCHHVCRERRFRRLH